MLKSSTDIILTSGAVSAGKFDYIPRVVKKFKTSFAEQEVDIWDNKNKKNQKITSRGTRIF